MFRKTTLAFAALLIATASSVAPALAAAKVSTGVACAKQNAVTKVGIDKYTCTTNPLSTSKKLVWVWQGCLDTNKAYVSTKSKYDAILKQIAGSSTTLTATIQTSINNMILWKATKSYVKDDVVFETGHTYYIALSDSKGKNPSANLGTVWAVYQPTAADANVGTSPDANTVVAMKEKDVVKWTNDVATSNKEITRLSGLKSPTAKDTTNLATYKAAVATFNIGIKNANTNIKNLKANLILLTNQQTNEATVKGIKSDVEQAKMVRDQSCANGL